ncbi:MAG: hypothetical protein ACI9J3_003409, partial [Parvicellaceae bacterium]
MKPIKTTLTFTVLLAIFSVSCFSQSSIKITVPSKAITVEKIVKTLAGGGMVVKNVTTNQNIGTNQLGRFIDPKRELGMNKGILLSTGSVLNLGSSNLFSGMTGSTYGGTIVEYDTITSTVPCNKFGSKKQNNNKTSTSKLAKVIDVAIVKVQDQEVQSELENNSVLTNIVYDWSSSDSSGETAVFTSSNATNYEVSEDGEMCTTTFILPKNKPFLTKSGDKDLEAELRGNFRTFDACVVEMDLVPFGDTLSFRYMFGSEEYDEYVCSMFNDAFAFYLSGPGIGDKKNMAVLESGARI